MIKSRLSDETVLVRFELPAAGTANSVVLCGDFNEWSPAVHPLARAEGGIFWTNIELTSGRRWHFRYLLDGQRWENDWAADAYVANDHGTEDSVVDLTHTSTLPWGAGSPSNVDSSQSDEAAPSTPDAAPASTPTRKAASRDAGAVTTPASDPAPARKISTAKGSAKPRKTATAGGTTRQRRVTTASATPPVAETPEGAKAPRRRKAAAPKPGPQTEPGR